MCVNNPQGFIEPLTCPLSIFLTFFENLIKKSTTFYKKNLKGIYRVFSSIHERSKEKESLFIQDRTKIMKTHIFYLQEFIEQYTPLLNF